MQKCVIILTLVLLLLFSCSSQPQNNTHSNTAATEPSEKSELTEIMAYASATASLKNEREDETIMLEESSILIELQAYLDFLQNDANFIECYYLDWNAHITTNGDIKSFSEYLSLGDGSSLQVKEFAIIDINADGTKDLILTMNHPTSASVRYIVLVLTYYDSSLYGISFTDRSFTGLKKDGTYFSTVVSSGHWGIMKLLFTSGVFSFEETRSPSYYGFYEEFCSFVEAQDQKENAKWITYSEATIVKDMSNAWDLNTIS